MIFKCYKITNRNCNITCQSADWSYDNRTWKLWNKNKHFHYNKKQANIKTNKQLNTLLIKHVYIFDINLQ